MNTKALNELAALICRAQEQDRTPMGIAFAIESAGRHMSPEVAAELRARTAELEHLVRQMCDGLNGHECPPPDESPMGTVTRFAVRLMEAERRVAELEAQAAPGPDAITQRIAPVQALRDLTVDGEHYALVHHSYRTPRDLPEPGGQR